MIKKYKKIRSINFNTSACISAILQSRVVNNESRHDGNVQFCQGGAFVIRAARVLMFCFGAFVFFQVSMCPEGLCQTSKLEKDERLLFWSSVRFRYELQNNFNLKSYGSDPVVGEEDDAFLLGRLRLGVKGRLTDTISYSAGIQHSEVWGLDIPESAFFKGPFGRQNNPYEDDFELFNTFVQVKELFSSSVDLKVGRQLLYYGDKRIFGPGQWGNTGRWMWDAAKLHAPFGPHFIDLYYGKTMIHDPDVFSLEHNHGFESIGIYSHFKFPDRYKGIVIEPFAMTKDSDGNEFPASDGSRGDLESYYFGLRIAQKDGRSFDWDLTYIQQRGDYADEDIEAYAYHLQFAYNVSSCPWKPRLGVDYSYASGDDDPTDGEMGTFDGAFGARDKMYGRMNLFHWKNLKDAQVHMTLHPRKDLQVVTRVHQFWLAEDRDAWYLNSRAYRDPTGRSGDEVGKELDLVACWDVGKGHQLQCGFGYFWPDEFAKRLASDVEAAWGFVQWRWKFSHALVQ